MIFQVSTAVYIQIKGFWEVAPGSLVHTYQLHFRVKRLKMEEPPFFMNLVAILQLHHIFLRAEEFLVLWFQNPTYNNT